MIMKLDKAWGKMGYNCLLALLEVLANKFKQRLVVKLNFFFLLLSLVLLSKH